jgi:murein L,D-transpeptidase YcbB/YkuD
VSLLISCAQGENGDSAESEASFENEDFKHFSEHLENELSHSDDSLIAAIYTNAASFWISEELALNEQGQMAVFNIVNAQHYGLNPKNYNATFFDSLPTPFTPEMAVSIELELSKSFFQFVKHLRYGMIPTTYHGKITDLKTKQDSVDLLAIFQDSNVVQAGLNMQPQHDYYQKLQAAVAKFYSENELTEDIIYIPNFKKDSVEAYTKAKEVLVKLNYLNPEDEGEKIIDAVKEFQKSNGLTPDGLIGKYTVKMLELSTRKMYFQAAANLEKWRWIEAWGDTYFFANIPEYMINVYHKDSLQIKNRTVVGTLVNKTPEVESNLDYFIVNPEWYVPYSITSKELIPKQKKDSTYLQRNGYALTSGGSLDAIDWNNVSASSIKIKQKSGGYNALGKVKFIFSNPHSVYFHDTPSKSFFKKDIRSYSHGCVRVQDPFEIADFILETEANPEWPMTLDSLLKYKKTKTFTPKKEYPVHIGYFTSTTDSSGRLRTLIDVYDKDTLLMKLFEEYYFETENLEPIQI